jgi:hypothetical protein
MKRKTSYTREKTDEVLTLMASGKSVAEICRMEDMPTRAAFNAWVISDVDGIGNRYARAREMQAEALVQELTEIADDGTNDWMTNNDPDNPGYVANGEHSARTRLRLDTRKWLASKILPKQYGERVALHHTTTVADATDADLIAIATGGGKSGSGSAEDSGESG